MTQEREPVRAHVWIAGRVQGVSFRAYTIDEASLRGVAGWIRNTPDGRVEAVFEGDKVAVEAMIAWCRKGPPAARVTSVEVKWEEPKGETSFAVQPHEKTT
ncbi:MAG: acylphosphatase [Candidatus Methylomirabilis sp.]